MMGERGVEVWTSTAQMQVVGKRHYGRKAVAARRRRRTRARRARELFDTLLLWKGRVKLDANGNATVEVPLNDSLTRFRIVAVAQRCGASVRHRAPRRCDTTQDLMLLSGLAAARARRRPVCRDVHAAQRHRAAADVSTRRRGSQSIARLRWLRSALTFRRAQARDIVWRVTAPVGVAQLQWDVSAHEVDGAAGDKIEALRRTSFRPYPVRTYQATIAQLTAPLSFPAERPAGAVPGRGGVEVRCAPSSATDSTACAST